jgi:type II secretory pathway pseudopilin PulG
MKSPDSKGQRALTRLEIMVVVVILAVLACLLMPSLLTARRMAQQINCVNQLKNVGLGLRIFSTDHEGKFPMALSVTKEGTREWLSDETQLWRHWGRLTNELTLAKLLLCPADKARQLTKPVLGSPPLLTWEQLTNNEHLSYFLGLVGSDADPTSILAGDRNLLTNGIVAGPGRLALSTNLMIGFSPDELHRGYGQLLYGDGSVGQLRTKTLDPAWFAAQTNSDNATKVWLVP